MLHVPWVLLWGELGWLGQWPHGTGATVAQRGGDEMKDKEENLAHRQGTYFSNIKANGGTLK